MKLLDAGQHAEGVIAIGQFATGFIAIGQVATGVIAVGQVARGVFCLGMLSCGLWSIGMVSLGLVWSGAMVGAGGRGKGLLLLELVPRLGGRPDAWRRPAALVCGGLQLAALVVLAVVYWLVVLKDAGELVAKVRLG